ncbi:MAG TPA: cysteine hydrolase [Desulfuromonadales bacterium]|nr:cysteine hydrolase [Desulfuromonadales bacterium]
MFTMFMILLTLIVLLACSAGLMMYRSMFVATKGKKISHYPEPRAALVVLDLQEGYAGTNARQPVTAPAPGSLLAKVNRLIDMAADSNMEVAYIRQVFSNNIFVRMHGGRGMGKIIIDRRIKVINFNDFEKNRTDAFSNRQFEQLLIDQQVNELYLVGVDAAYCVYYTALGGLQRGYTVNVVSDAVATRSNMTEILDRYRRKGIGVISSAELIAAERQPTV